MVDLKKPGKPRRITPYAGAYSGIRGGLAWSPDGQKLIFASDFGVYIVAKGGDLKKVKTVWYPHDFAWSPDGKILAFIGQIEQRGFDSEIYLLDVEQGQIKQLTDDRENVRGGGKSTFAWSPDGSRLIYGTSRLPGQKVQVIELSRQRPSPGEPKGGTNVTPFVLISSGVQSSAQSDCPYQERNDGTI